ncbi:uncharacterized protein B0I36DRAFT_319387 [Microdochium trichocladiopsis]|uniref:Uncharacterized protein n=1 Tax=Microdochium trichocladiopsis TaxID=1682393 RepID=A0A9P8YFA4_9PEZI|nr:uncharacterized protein B0I36DRAFT_319387 [Microdochium trichocladiopsis]KAH7035928.1 hypothetical protein B0I36DRAFT_319387 [Microdochium trichocladiopsis]
MYGTRTCKQHNPLKASFLGLPAEHRNPIYPLVLAQPERVIPMFRGYDKSHNLYSSEKISLDSL